MDVHHAIPLTEEDAEVADDVVVADVVAEYSRRNDVVDAVHNDGWTENARKDNDMTVSAVHIVRKCTVNDDMYRWRTASSVAVQVAPVRRWRFITVVGPRRQVDRYTSSSGSGNVGSRDAPCCTIGLAAVVERSMS